MAKSQLSGTKDGTVELAIQAPPLPRLNAPAPRSGVVGPSRLALRQYLADYERDLSGAFHAGADVELLLKARTQAVERVLASDSARSAG